MHFAAAKLFSVAVITEIRFCTAKRETHYVRNEWNYVMPTCTQHVFFAGL